MENLADVLITTEKRFYGEVIGEYPNRDHRLNLSGVQSNLDTAARHMVRFRIYAYTRRIPNLTAKGVARCAMTQIFADRQWVHRPGSDSVKAYFPLSNNPIDEVRYA